MVIAVRIGSTALLCLHRLFIDEVSAHPRDRQGHVTITWKGNAHGAQKGGQTSTGVFVSRLLWSP